MCFSLFFSSLYFEVLFLHSQQRKKIQSFGFGYCCCLLDPPQLHFRYFLLGFVFLQAPRFWRAPNKKRKKKEERERKKSKVPLCAFFLLSTCGISALWGGKKIPFFVFGYCCCICCCCVSFAFLKGGQYVYSPSVMAEEGKEEVDDFGCSSNCKLQLAILA